MQLVHELMAGAKQALKTTSTSLIHINLIDWFGI